MKVLYLKTLRFINKWTVVQIEKLTDIFPYNEELNNYYALGIKFAADEAYHLLTMHGATPKDVVSSLEWHANYHKEKE